MKSEEQTKLTLADWLYEVGTLKTITRSHRQSALINDSADNIASHSHRVSIIAWYLAKEENCDPFRALAMAAFHDVPETRSGDQNWIHKRYVKVDEDQIIKDQLAVTGDKQIEELFSEHEARVSKEAIVAKDADIIDQILLLTENYHRGNKEAGRWLRINEHKNVPGESAQLKALKTESAKKLAHQIISTEPTNWWHGIWTSKNT